MLKATLLFFPALAVTSFAGMLLLSLLGWLTGASFGPCGLYGSNFGTAVVGLVGVSELFLVVPASLFVTRWFLRG